MEKVRRTTSRPKPSGDKATAEPASHGLARIISKRGICSRTQAAALVRAGDVRVDGVVVRDPERRTRADAKIEIGNIEGGPVARRYLMLNKPRGLVTTTSDEKDRDTVYACFAGAGLPWIAPVGRLDKASEGLLLFSNDSAWAARVSAANSGVDKCYHVQVACLPDANLYESLCAGVELAGERLLAKAVRELRRGEKNAWLEITLDEGRNRHIRRLLAAFDIQVLRLIRVSIGPLQLGNLGKRLWRELTSEEVDGLNV